MSIGYVTGEYGCKREFPVRFLPGRSGMAQGHARKDADGAPRANAVTMLGAGHPTAGERPRSRQEYRFSTLISVNYSTF